MLRRWDEMGPPVCQRSRMLGRTAPAPIFPWCATCLGRDNLIARANAIEHLLPLPFFIDGDAHENAAAADGRSGKHVVAQFVFADYFERLGRRLDDEGLARFVDGE